MQTYDLEGNLIEVDSDPIINSLERTPILDAFPDDLVGIAVAIPAKDGKPRMAFLPLNLFATKDQFDVAQRSLATMGESVGRTIKGLASKDEIPDISNLASKDDFNQLGEMIPDISGLVSAESISGLDDKVNSAIDKADGAGKDSASATKIANEAMDLASTRARKYSLGDITLTEKAALALAAGITNLVVDCKEALVGDVFSVVPSSALPSGYMLGMPSCTTAGKIQISVFHPALALNGGYTIPCKVFAFR